MNQFEELQIDVHRTAVKKGWWDVPREDGTILCLIHGEVSEAMEALRKGNELSEKIPEYSQLDEELADIVIRVMDYAESRGIPLFEVMKAKAKYNEGRSHRHGNKQF